MSDIFNATLLSSDGLSKPRQAPPEIGLLAEINAAASETFDWPRSGDTFRGSFKITHGKQISRPLTAAGAKAGLSGVSQMIGEPSKGNKYRGVDMVFEDKAANNKLTIVEVKAKSNVDTSQLAGDVQLASCPSGKLMYVILNRESQAQAIRDAYKRTPGSNQLPPIEVTFLLAEDFAQTYNKKGGYGSLGFIPTWKDRVRFGRHGILAKYAADGAPQSMRRGAAELLCQSSHPSQTCRTAVVLVSYGTARLLVKKKP